MRRFLALLILLTAPSWAATYYVDCAADPGGDGTTQATSGEHAAWDLVADVNGASFSAGDSILFKKGCTWREQLTVPSSGSAGNPITLAEYGTGEKPIVSGANIATGWTQHTGGGTENEGDTHGTAEFQGQSIYLFMVTTTSGGVLTSYKTYMGASGPTRMKCALYSNKMVGENYTPDALIANTTSEEITSFAPNSWVTLNVASGATLTGGTIYWLAKWGNGANYYGGQGNVGGVWRYRQTGDTYPTFPATCGSLAYDGTPGDGQYFVITLPSFTNVYKATVASTVAGAFEDGAWMEPVASPNAVDATANTWFWASNVLYAHASDSSDITSNGKTYEAAIRSTGVTVSGKNYLTLDGLDVKNASTDGVYVAGNAAHVYATNCLLHHNVKNGFHAYEPAAGGHTLDNVRVIGCAMHHNGKDGLRLENRTTNLIVDGCVAYQNTWFHDAADPYSAGIRVVNYAVAGSAQTSTGALFQNNLVYNNGKNDAGSVRPSLNSTNEGMGLWFDTVGTGGIIRHNKCYGNQGAAGIHVEATDGAHVYANLSHNNDKYGILVDTYLADLGYISTNNLIYNNVFYGNGWSGIANYGHDSYTGGESSVNNVFKNNISVGNTGESGQGKQLKCAFGGENVHAAGGWGSGNVFLYNCLGAESSDFVRWGWDTAKATYDAWETAYGDTTSSVEADPLFTNAAGGDFTLQAGSPCIDAGVNLGSTYLEQLLAGSTWPAAVETMDWHKTGGAPDVGAYGYRKVIW